MSLNKFKKLLTISLFSLLGIFLIFPTHAAKEENDAIGFEEKQLLQVSEVYTGIIKGIYKLEENKEDVGRDYYFELEVTEVNKSSKGARIGDTEKVRFAKGAVIITGNKPMMAQVGDVVRIYANNSRLHPGYLELKYGGDSISIIKGDLPTDWEVFLALFGIDRSNIYLVESLKVVAVLLVAIIIAKVFIRVFKIHKK